jgi:hypothetical protein
MENPTAFSLAIDEPTLVVISILIVIGPLSIFHIIFPRAHIFFIVIINVVVSALAMPVIVHKIPFVDIPVGERVLALAVFFAVDKITLVAITVAISQHASAIEFVIIPLSIVGCPIPCDINALAFLYIIRPVALIIGSTTHDDFAKTVKFVIRPLAGIACAGVISIAPFTIAFVIFPKPIIDPSVIKPVQTFPIFEPAFKISHINISAAVILNPVPFALAILDPTFPFPVLKNCDPTLA